MKFLTTLLLFGSLYSYASGECQGRVDVHDDFCHDFETQVCLSHLTCHWVEKIENPRTFIYIPRQCMVKDSMQVHSHLCENSDHQTCLTHSQFCSWR